VAELVLVSSFSIGRVFPVDVDICSFCGVEEPGVGGTSMVFQFAYKTVTNTLLIVYDCNESVKFSNNNGLHITCSILSLQFPGHLYIHHPALY